jgi:hypothetical protein
MCFITLHSAAHLSCTWRCFVQYWKSTMAIGLKSYPVNKSLVNQANSKALIIFHQTMYFTYLVCCSTSPCSTQPLHMTYWSQMYDVQLCWVASHTTPGTFYQPRESGASTIESHYEAMASEDWEDFICAVVPSRSVQHIQLQIRTPPVVTLKCMMLVSEVGYFNWIVQSDCNGTNRTPNSKEHGRSCSYQAGSIRKDGNLSG